jgi:hypothetical protein
LMCVADGGGGCGYVEYAHSHSGGESHALPSCVSVCGSDLHSSVWEEE